MQSNSLQFQFYFNTKVFENLLFKYFLDSLLASDVVHNGHNLNFSNLSMHKQKCKWPDLVFCHISAPDHLLFKIIVSKPPHQLFIIMGRHNFLNCICSEAKIWQKLNLAICIFACAPFSSIFWERIGPLLLLPNNKFLPIILWVFRFWWIFSNTILGGLEIYQFPAIRTS